MRIAEILRIPPAITDAPDAVTVQRVSPLIELQDVSFVYPNGTKALENVTCRIEPGQRVAIGGRSGAGKSTRMKLLLRFYDPTAGAICIDQSDIRRFTVSSLRDQIAVVQQDTVLFGLSISENIALGNDQADKSAIRRVARAVGAHEFIEQLPDGYDTNLNERGTTLSGGQRQRIALARALLRDAPILILDEPASGLDAQVAKLAESTWMKPQADRAVIVICHDYSHMEHYDKIVVMDCGRVLDVGTHAQLLKGCDGYAALHQAWLDRSRGSSAAGEGTHAYQPQRLAH